MNGVIFSEEWYTYIKKMGRTEEAADTVFELLDVLFDKTYKIKDAYVTERERIFLKEAILKASKRRSNRLFMTKYRERRGE